MATSSVQTLPGLGVREHPRSARAASGGFAVWASFPLAVLLGMVSLAGIFLRSTYARESASWAAQGIGQDWVDLVLVTPALALTGFAARRGARSSRLVLGGLYVYTLYAFVIYALAMHFNALFFLYCAVLGLSFFATAALIAGLIRDGVSSGISREVAVGFAGTLLVALALLFAAMWLAEDVPAVLSGREPASLTEVGLITNPVHVLDLAIALPALMLAGIELLRRRALGFVVAPVMLGFALFMALAIGGMMVSLAQRGLGGSVVAALPFAFVALLCGIALARLLRGIERAPLSASPGARRDTSAAG